MLTQQVLKELLTYDPLTGIFKWIPKPKSFRRKYEAGCLAPTGYILIGMSGKHYLAHRLAFLYMNGEWPKQQVDHINRVRNDNRWENLREATPSQNNVNKTNKRNLPIGICEIQRKNRKGIWYSTSIQFEGKKYNSSFRKLEDAIEWRKRKEDELFK